MGGSFGTRGGQNRLEAAAYGAKVAFGPRTWNFRRIVRALLEQEAAWELPALDALEGWVDDQLSRPAAGTVRADRAVNLIRSHQGATERTWTLLNTLLETTAR